ncbi:hypothetical protein [Streptomyces sp. NPDC047985]|uniref:hypothetical protein n=1 Tax=Streptomyces sp. NPDC047985 TaxID=3155384 RepID=UPI003446A853
MGRHSLPDDSAAGGRGEAPPRRRRPTVAIATVPVLDAGTAVVVRAGPRAAVVGLLQGIAPYASP